MSKYRPAPVVAAIAEDLIETVPAFEDLAEVRIEYLFIDKAPISHGRLVLGRARKVSGLSAYLAAPARSELPVDPAPLFVIEISEDTWVDMDDAKRRALVDHELMHCRVDVATDRQLRLAEWSAPSKNIGAAVAERLALAIDDVVNYVEDLGNRPPTPPEGGDGE